MFKKVSIVAIITVVVVSLTIVAIAKYKRVVQPAIARGLSTATNPNGLSNLEADTLISAAKAAAAPEFAKGIWINSDPLTLLQLRGHVVLVEFWAIGCDNCRNTLPAVKEWDAKYRDRGLTIIGVHTPETDSGLSDFPYDKLIDDFLQSLGFEKYSQATSSLRSALATCNLHLQNLKKREACEVVLWGAALDETVGELAFFAHECVFR